MSVKVANSRFIVSSVSKSAALYQHIFSRVSSFQELGNWLIKKAELAKAVRHTEILEEVALPLANFPIQEYQLIGQYYGALSECLKGGKPQRELEEVLEKSHTYKARALIGLAAVEAQNGNYQAELDFFTQALKFANNPSVILEAQRGIAVVKAKEGFHTQAVRDFEKVFPLVRHVDTYAYYQYLNSFAVELGEIGRIQEAQNISKIVLASPYAFAYPEWRETGDDITLRGYKSRSSVLIIQPFSEPEKIQNVLYMPQREPSTTPIQSIFGPAPVHSIEKWKKKMVKSNGDEKLDNLSEKDLVLKILHMSSEEGISWKKLRKIIDYISKVKSEPDD